MFELKPPPDSRDVNLIIKAEVVGSGFIFQGQGRSAQVELALPSNTHTTQTR